jgi:hypothetical protein
LVNGHHYAYVQAIDQHREKYVGSKFNISFYTINSSSKERWWLGEMPNVSVVAREESKEIYAAYNKE